ncbi:MAG: glycosyltransferase family 39 protein [Azonexus sp.]|jgi:4-amino-4-deoxy-L-arabinose transferase-like glycosyltransferase|nr:glycosyltransferase family 39 protein [Azonexus sp.]
MTTDARLSRDSLLFWGAALILLFVQLGATGPWQSEDRWLEIVREMLASGDYLQPRLNGELYFDKPLLSYWLIAALSHLTGSLSEWTLRAPSVIAGLITLWATRDLAGRVADRQFAPQVALLSGWLLLTSFGFLQWARMGEADMENLAACTLAVAWYWRCRDRMRGRDYLAFYLILAVGAQCKGLTAIIVPMLALLPDILRERRWRTHLNLPHLLAAGLAAVLYLLPFALSPRGSMADSHGGLALVLRENIVRYVAPFDHTGPLYTYLIALPQYLLPWSLLFCAALAAALSGRLAEPNIRRWLLPTLALLFAFFTLSGSRRNYYILPLLPYCALLIGVWLQQYRSGLALRLSASLLAIVALTLLLAPLLWSLGAAETYRAALPPLTLALCTMPVGWGILETLALSHQGRVTLLSACIAAAALLFAGFFFMQQPLLDDYRSEVAFARQLAALRRAQPEAALAIYRDKPVGRLLYYGQLTPPVPILRDPAAVAALAHSGDGEKWLLVYGRNEAELAATLADAAPLADERQFPWEAPDRRDKLRLWRLAAR